MDDRVVNSFFMFQVDLAGSERNEDSWEHDAEQRKQCAEINSRSAAHAVRVCALWPKAILFSPQPAFTEGVRAIARQGAGNSAATAPSQSLCFP